MEINVVYGCLQVYICIFEGNFHKIKKKLENYQKPSGKTKTSTFTNTIDILCSLSARESHYFEEISNPKKSVCGRISTFLMSAF